MPGDCGNDSVAVLELAREVLNDHGVDPVRTAALLARQALEQAVDVLCGPGMRRATMRSRLLYVRCAHDPEIADCAVTAWIGLSNACHHHAYELAPTAGEVSHLMDLVSAVTGESR